MSKRILVISDMHIPYAHLDLFKFLKAVKKKYKPDRVICIGDEIDWHSISFHEHNPDLHAPGKELEEAVKQLKKIYEIFPEVTVLNSNHGSLALRKAVASGLPSRVIRSPKEFLEAPRGWNWVNHITIKASNGSDWYFHHGKNANILMLAQSIGINAVSGHFHEKFCVQSYQTPRGIIYGMSVGCLIDNEALCFNYNKTNLKDPVIGCGIILNGIPKLLPLIMDKKGRWTKELP